MPQVAVSINGRSYPVACESGKEDHVAKLADYVNSKVGMLTKSVGQVGDTRLLVLASLLVADELSDALGELSTVRGQPPADTERAKLAQRIEVAAAKIEGIVARLERP